MFQSHHLCALLMFRFVLYINCSSTVFPFIALMNVVSGRCKFFIFNNLCHQNEFHVFCCASWNPPDQNVRSLKELTVQNLVFLSFLSSSLENRKRPFHLQQLERVQKGLIEKRPALVKRKIFISRKLFL